MINRLRRKGKHKIERCKEVPSAVEEFASI